MTNRKNLWMKAARMGLAGAVLAGMIGLVQAQAPTGSSTPPDTSMGSQSSTNATSKQLRDDMMSGMMKMHEMKPTGDADKDFAHMMEHHHEQAVKMTQTYLKGAKDPQLKAWAEKSLQNQQKELAELQKIAPKD